MNLGAVRVAVIPRKGRGVVAARQLHAGEEVDLCPVIELTGDDCDRLEETTLGHYYFAHPTSEDHGCFILGTAALLNHADPSNIRLDWRSEGELGWVVAMIAKADIGEGEELTYSYACPLWFEPAP